MGKVVFTSTSMVKDIIVDKATGSDVGVDDHSAKFADTAESSV